MRRFQWSLRILMIINIRKKPSYYRDINEWMNDEFTYVSLRLEEYDLAVIGCVLFCDDNMCCEKDEEERVKSRTS